MDNVHLLSQAMLFMALIQLVTKIQLQKEHELN